MEDSGLRRFSPPVGSATHPPARLNQSDPRFLVYKRDAMCCKMLAVTINYSKSFPNLITTEIIFEMLLENEIALLIRVWTLKATWVA